jgi:hypothetical protein
MRLREHNRMKTPITRNNSPTETVTRNSNNVAPTVEEIRRRAYEIFLARGGVPGTELEDWLSAEQELKQRDGPRVS